MKKSIMTAGTPLISGTVIAAASITQGNYVGGGFALVTCAVISSVLHFKSRRRRRPAGA
ncbi:hypothetical protein OKJ48_00095 [Streptomyces kunmingensis]|uniref:Uncharacterized protein n=1 Tax=Streptomyces kunmingensis TaxID=68225 RepID=A0ABU6C4A6_9ACTN|nr:hypothetical protein [Streptomyces kunmingensis]MEB3958670.1 hypothetical protein [Streptomyces kunmingensis]